MKRLVFGNSLFMLTSMEIIVQNKLEWALNELGKCKKLAKIVVSLTVALQRIRSVSTTFIAKKSTEICPAYQKRFHD